MDKAVLDQLKSAYNRLLNDLEEYKEDLIARKESYEAAKRDVESTKDDIIEIQKQIKALDPEFEDLSYCQL